MDFSKIDLTDNQELAREIIQKAANKITHGELERRGDFEKLRNRIVKQRKGRIFHNLYFIKAYNDLVKEGNIEADPELLQLIQKRSVRTMSGVAPVTVLTKPFPCPGRCIYCPTDVRMPKSYLPSQPAAQRAFRQRFDPYTQIFVRLKAMKMTGHEVSKVELRVIGGSWSAYTKHYQTEFLKRCLQAMNEFHDQIADGKTDKVGDMTVEKKIKSKYGIDVVNTVVLKSLASNKAWGEVVKENETALIRCIGINIETRPDLISEQEIHRLRFLGVTKVEMGVQTTDDKIHKLTKRGHLIAEVRKATQLLKDAGFKVGYHMMPNLPGTSPKKDIEMIRELFENQDFQPDYLKIYPCVVIPGTELSKMYKAGDFKPYNENVLEDVLFESICFVPEWCRIDRIARDIPSNEVEFGFKKSNIRQILEKRLVEEGRNCKDIRYREIRAAKFQDKDVKLVVRKYEASGGKEFFISFEDVKKDKLVALLRLRLPGSNFISELEDAALIREVHVYGKQIPVGEKGRGYSQHIGWGTKLMNEAERIASEAGFKKIAVISAIGTREYYKKKKYELKGTYMVKMI